MGSLEVPNKKITKSLTKSKEIHWKQPSKVSTISFSEFINRATNVNSTDDFVYYSSHLSVLPQHLVDDIYPIEDFKINVDESEAKPTYSVFFSA